MWTTAEVIDKGPADNGFSIVVQYGTDDAVPFLQNFSVFVGIGQDPATILKGAVIQQLADLNAKDAKKSQLDALQVAVDAIPLGPVDTKV